MKEIKFEQKYKNLKSKFMASVDLAFRLGFEQGQQKAAQDQMAQQQQQAELQAAQEAQMQGQGQPGQDDGSGDPSQGGGAPGQGQPPQENPMGSELDQHLNELEGMLGKAELSDADLKKTMGAITAIKSARELKKSHEAIKGIGLALHTPKYQMSKQASHNLTDTAKNSLHIQKKIVDDVFKSWDEEEKHTHNAVHDILSVEGLIKK